MKRQLVTRFGGAVLLGAILIGGAGLAHATTSYSNYDTTVARFDGDGYTGGQRKVVSGFNGTIKSRVVGGPYQVDAQMQRTDGSQGGPWVRLDDGTVAHPQNSIPAGTTARIRFSNDLLTPVNVQVSGQFRVY